jgi:DNA-binding NarL/FixJ family response regulator
MMPVTHTGSVQPARSTASRLSEIVGAAGTERFGGVLLSFLNLMCGAGHCAVFHFKRDGLRELAAGSLDGTDTAHRSTSLYLQRQFWRKDEAISEARSCANKDTAVIVRMEMSDIAGTDLCESVYPKICERIVVAGRWRTESYGLSILRTHDQGAFSDADLECIAEHAELLVSLLGNHADLLVRRPNLALALTSLSEIENCLTEMSDLPRREVEACSRLLFGMCTLGIALDLGIGEHSVKTYRKRAYLRLQIGSARELLIWYLGLWSAWHGYDFPEVEARARRLEVH